MVGDGDVLRATIKFELIEIASQGNENKQPGNLLCENVRSGGSRR